MDSSVKQKILEDNSKETESELSKNSHVINEKNDVIKSKNEIKSDTDDIENLLTAHVMCKSSTEEANDDVIDELTKTNKETKKLKPKCTTDIKKNTKNVLSGNNQINFDRKKQIVVNKSDRKSIVTSKFRKFVGKNKESNDKNFGTSKTKDPYLKIRVKSQQDLGLEEHRSKAKFESNVSKNTNKTSDKQIDEKNNCDEVQFIKNQCRLCGAIITNKIESSNLNPDLNGKIVLHLNIEIKENDHLPQSVCDTCIDKIVNWSQFYEKCSTFQKELNNSRDQHKKKVESAENMFTQSKCQDNSEIETSENPINMNIKKEIADNIEVEDTIEKMLREMHAETTEDEQQTIVNEKSDKHPETHVSETPEISTNVNSPAPNLDDPDVQNETDDDMDMDVEFLEEERDLVDQALICQHQKVRQPPVIKEEQSSRRKIIRMDRKLSETELRSLLERTGFSHLSFVTILKFGGKPSLVSADIDKFYKNFRDKLTLAKNSDKDNKSNIDKEYYDMLLKSYAQHILESVQTDSEIFFRCPECRVYLPSGELPRHIQTDHGKITALCDFCKLILPYDSETNKDLIREHIELHNADKMSNHPEVILNTCKLLENTIDNHELLISSIKQEEAPDYSGLSTNINKKPIPKNRYRCNQCSARFQSAHLVREHVRTHRPEDVTCQYCNEKFTSRYNLENHEKSEHLTTKDSQYTCEYCNLEFPDEQSYEQHINSEQNLNANTFKCPHCAEQFPDRYGLAKHIKDHPEQTTFCDYCGLAFGSRTDMKSHQKHVHVRDLYTCSQCGCKNFSKISLRNHMRTHHPDVGTPGSPFGCSHCDQSFQTANRLREHVIKVHNTIKNFQCPLCDWNFNQEINLKKHFEFHIDKNHTNCKVCHQPFEIAGEKLEISDVVAHKEQHTVEENFVYQRPYSPSVSRMTPWRDAIPPQSGARMFCRDCGIACSTPMELRKHQKTHKPFYCTTCQTVSNNEQTFLLHMEQHADRKHGCKICGKRFMTRTALNLHSRIHASSPKFMCAVCSRKFRIVTDWKRHERSCRESHGWPRMEFDASNRNSSGRRLKRARTQDRYVNLVQNNENASFAELVEDGNNITYEFVEDDSTSDPYAQSFSTTENGDQNTYVEYIVQEDNSDDVIEIDETQLAEFQEWQRSAQLTSNLTTIKREIVSYAENNKDTSNEMMEISDPENATASVYYSVEDYSGNKKEYRFLPHYVIQGNDENIDSSQTGMDMSNESDSTIGVIPSKYILPDDQVILNDNANSLILNASSQDGSNVVYVDSSNIIYNIQNSINLPQNIGTISGQNIIFQQDDSNSEQMSQDDQLLQSNNHISYVFNDTGEESEGGVTIYVKESETVDETLSDINKQTNDLESSENNVHISENS